MYQQPLQQPQASHSASSTQVTTGVSGANALDLAPSMTLNSAVTIPTEAMEMSTLDDLGNYAFDSPPDFTFGATNQQVSEMMDFVFDPISVPGNEETLAAMRAIQSPNWLENMLMPGYVVDGVPFFVIRTCPYFFFQILLACRRTDAAFNGSNAVVTVDVLLQ